MDKQTKLNYQIAQGGKTSHKYIVFIINGEVVIRTIKQLKKLVIKELNNEY